MTDATKRSREGRGGPAEAAGRLGLKGRHDPEMSLEVAWGLPWLWQSRSGGWEGAGGRKHRLCPGGSVEKGRGWQGLWGELRGARATTATRGSACLQEKLRSREGGAGAGEMDRGAEPGKAPDLRGEREHAVQRVPGRKKAGEMGAKPLSAVDTAQREGRQIRGQAERGDFWVGLGGHEGCGRQRTALPGASGQGRLGGTHLRVSWLHPPFFLWGGSASPTCK